MLSKRILVYITCLAACICLLISCPRSKSEQPDLPKHMDEPLGKDTEQLSPPPPPSMGGDGRGKSDNDNSHPDPPGEPGHHGHQIPDSDGDGVNDEEDRCPNDPGPRANQGCPLVKGQVWKYDSSNRLKIPDTGYRYRRLPKVTSFPHIVPLPLPHAGKMGDTTIVELERKAIIMKSAALSISFPYTMKQEEIRDFRVFISIRFPESKIKEQMQKIQISEMAFTDMKIKDTIITRAIELYKNVRVKVIVDPKDLEVTPISGNEKQLVDSMHGNYWYWHIKAISDKPTVLVTVSINAERYVGDPDDLTVTNIPINIKIDNITGLRKSWNWVISNPGYSIPSLLVPFIIFLFARKKAAAAKTG